MPRSKSKKIMGKSISLSRKFRGETFYTDFKPYDSRLKAKSVMMYMKTKNVSMKARVINKKKFFILYFDKSTYNRVKYQNLEIPSFESIPIEFIEMINEKQNVKYRKASDQKHDIKEIDTVLEIQSNYTASGKERKEKYQVVKLDNKVSQADFMQKSQKKKKNVKKDEDEESIDTAIKHVEKQFFKSCPKCASQMKPNFIVLGPVGRMSVYQCMVCKFYLPRNVTD